MNAPINTPSAVLNAKIKLAGELLFADDTFATTVQGLVDGDILTDALLESGELTQDSVVGLLSEATGYRAIDPGFISFDEVFIEHISMLIPKAVAEKYCVFPIKHKDNNVHLVMRNPLDAAQINDLQVITGSRIKPYCCPSERIKTAIEKNFRDSDAPRKDFEPVRDTAVRVVNRFFNYSGGEINTLIEHPAIINLFRLLLSEAVQLGVSDLHFESQADGFRVRVRQDGVLRILWSLPQVLGRALIGRIKLVAELDALTETQPQDGRIGYDLVANKSMDVRVSTLPGLYGEKAVLRLLDKGKSRITLEEMKLDDVSSDRIDAAIRRPHGLVLVTGPTGSGKTTTLYSIIDKLNHEGVNIVTAEDPVEYDFPGITQVACGGDSGLSFFDALKSFMRQDPDIVMVGEIRELETCDIATKAALTGHLVLSTLHTNDAPSALTRLVNIGVKPYLIAACNVTIVAQRLLRRNCESCLESYTLTAQEAALLEAPVDISRSYMRGAGCDACGQTGYRGRMAITEVLVMDGDIEDLLIANQSAENIRQKAIENGMASLRANAVTAFENNLTTHDEVLRLTVL